VENLVADGVHPAHLRAAALVSRVELGEVGEEHLPVHMLACLREMAPLLPPDEPAETRSATSGLSEPGRECVKRSSHDSERYP
jgi:hypothetical protein